jgi:hypothetical protein
MKILYFVLLLLATHSCTGQSFFETLPKAQAPAFAGNRFYKMAVPTPVVDSTMNAIRPLANIVAYGEPGNILMAGAGVSYQHLKWIPSTQKWYCEWSVAAMGWAGGSVAPSTPAQAVSYGLMVGILNNLIMVGPALNGNKVQAVISIGVNLNN